MPKNIQPSWLNYLNSPADGIGDGSDLKHTVFSQNQKWLSKVRPGWTYLDGKEDYYYIDMGLSTFTNTSTGTLTANSNLNPGWGPVHLYSDDYDYLEINEYLSPAVNVTWTASGNYSYYSVASGAVLTDVRDLSIVPMVKVASIDKLIHEKQYCIVGNNVFIKVSSPNNKVFLDLVSLDTKLLVEEILWVKNDQIHLMYSEPIYGYLQKGLLTQPITGTTNTVTIADDYEWVKAHYYVNRSFIITGDRTISVMGSSPVDLTLEYEKSAPFQLPVVRVQNDENKEFNFSPFYEESFGAGYLVMTPEITGFDTEAASIEILSSHTSFKSDWNEEVLVTIKILDKNGNLIPRKTCVVNITGTELNGLSPTETRNDGSILLRLTNNSNLEIEVEVDGLTKNLIIPDESSPITSSFLSTGRANLVVTNTGMPDGGRASYLNYTFMTGVPVNATLYLRAKKSTKFSIDNQDYTKVLSTLALISPGNPSAISQKISIKPGQGDTIWCNNTTAQSNRIKVNNVE